MSRCYRRVTLPARDLCRGGQLVNGQVVKLVWGNEPSQVWTEDVDDHGDAAGYVSATQNYKVWR